MTQAGGENNRGRSGSGRLALAWQVPLLALAVVVWVVFIGVGQKQSTPEPVSAEITLSTLESAFSEERFQDVHLDCQRFLDAFPEHPEAVRVRSWLGRSAFELMTDSPDESGKLEQVAIANMRKALENGLDGADGISARKALAQVYMSRGDTAQAGPLVDRLVEEDVEGSLGLLRQLGEAHFRTGHVESGERVLENALVNAREPEERVSLGLLLARGLRKGDAPGRAEAVLREIAKKHPQSLRLKRVQFELGMALADQRKPDEARKVFLSVLAMRPKGDEVSMQAQFKAADCLFESGRAEEAEREFVKISQGSEGGQECTAARMRLARIHLDSKRWKSARTELGRLLSELADGAIPLGQTDEVSYLMGLTYQREAEALTARAEKLMEQGLIHGARKLRDDVKALKLRAATLYLKVVNNTEMARSPLFGKALWQAAACFYEGGDYAQAVVYYGLLHTSVENDDQRGRARMQHGRAIAALGNHMEAIENFDSVLAEFPGTLHACEAQYAKALSYVALAQWDEAGKTLADIVRNEEQMTTQAEVWKRSLPLLGYVSYRRGDYALAVVMLDEAQTRKLAMPESDTGMPGVTFYLAESLRQAKTETVTARLENLQRAVALYGEVIADVRDREGADEPLHQVLSGCRFARAGCLFELGRYEAAAQAYREFSELHARSAEAVTALYRTTTCYERLGRTDEAARARQLAGWAAGRLDSTRATGTDEVLTAYWRALDRAGSMNSSRQETGQQGAKRD